MAINLLESWKQEAFLLSSALYKHQPAPLNRKGVQSIYNVLKRTFPVNFFISRSTSISDSNWINNLLIQPRHLGSINALKDICILITFYEQVVKKVPALEKRFNSLKAYPSRLRDFFFELYTYQLLLYNKIRIDVNAERGNQTLEGLCELGDKWFMFECKTLTIPNLTQLDLQYYITTSLIRQIQVQRQITGMIGMLKFNIPLKAKLKHIYDKKIKEFWQWFEKPKPVAPLHYKIEDGDGLFEVIPYSQASRIEVDQNQEKYHVIFMVIPPFMVVPGIENHYRVQVQLHFALSQNDIQSKLQEALRKKRRQHSGIENRIFFIQSEAINELSIAIFRTANMFDEKQIETYYFEKYGETDILVFIIRDYTTDVASTRIKVFCHPTNDHLKEQIEKFKIR